MPNFRYQARDSEGRHCEGIWEASDLRQAREELGKRGFSLLSLEPEVARAPEKPPGGWDLGVSRQDLARFTRQLSTLVRSGLPLLKALEGVSRRSAGPSMRRATAQVARQLQEGTGFSQALSSQPQVFDDLYVAMVRVGEVSGDLADATERLARLLEREVSSQRRMALAMAYPLIILGVAGLLTWGMATFMMPIFEPMFKESGLELKHDYPVTWLLLQAGHLGGSPLFLALAAGLLVGLGLALRAVGRTRGGRLLLDGLQLGLPVVGGLVRTVLTARLARGLAALTRGGVPLVQAVTQAGDATGNRAYAARVAQVAQGIQEGRSLSGQMAGQRIFNPTLVDMVEVGEQSGSLPEMLERAADYFDEEADGQRELLTTAMEPFMMLLVGAIVSVFVVALIVPLMSLGH